jgi:hypothetical protein
MTILERLDTSISQLPGLSPVARPSDNHNNTIALAPARCWKLVVLGNAAFAIPASWSLYALYALCREVVDITDGNAPRPLKMCFYPTGVAKSYTRSASRAPLSMSCDPEAEQQMSKFRSGDGCRSLNLMGDRTIPFGKER